MRRLAFALLICAAINIAAAPQAPVWEVVQTETPVGVESTPTTLDVAVREGVVYISSDSKVKVEVFTILGQLVTAKTVPAGVTKLSLGQRGVYILKVAGTTRRINI